MNIGAEAETLVVYATEWKCSVARNVLVNASRR